MSDNDKDDYDKIRTFLLEKFCSDPVLAYEQLIRRKLIEGESAESYFSDVCRLGRLADKEFSDKLLKSAFLAGLPFDIKEKLRASNDLNALPINDVVKRARTIVKASEVCASAVVGTANDIACVVERKTVKCFSCGKVGHFSRDCKQRQLQYCTICNTKGHSSRNCSQRCCYVCGDKSHIANTCPQRKTKKRMRGEPFCASGISPNFWQSVPVINAKIFNHNVKCLVDSGCTHSIVSESLVRLLNLKTSQCNQNVYLMNGSASNCESSCVVPINVFNRVINLHCLVSNLLFDYDDPDFTAKFDDGWWTVKWRWRDEAPRL